MDIAKKVKELAFYEISWWKAHHRKNQADFIDSASKLYCLQFGIDENLAKQAVLLKVEAADWHDKAEDLEDKGDQEQADIFWDKAEECLTKHFELLEKK